MIVSVSRIRWSGGWRSLLQFMPVHAQLTKLVARTPGYLDGWLLQDGWRTYWAVSFWADAAPLREAQRDWHAVMEACFRLCDEVAHAEWETAVEPSEVEITERLRRAPRFGPLPWPSRRQLRGEIPAPRFGLQFRLAPSR